MIDLYTWDTPNGHKGRIALEECGLDYNLHPVNILIGETLTEDYRAISPSRRIPTVVDSDGPDGKPLTLIESGVILTYYAEKTGSSLYPTDPFERLEVDQWALHGQSTFPGWVNHLALFESRLEVDVPEAKKVFRQRSETLYATIDLHLGEHAYFACGTYTVADIAHFVWVNRHDQQKLDLSAYPNVQRWFEKILERPAIQRGLAIVGG